ncbi:MAG: TatD family hydrolase [Lachnospiraceae bacterium]|nr:TatD family hydrolase [Lachnospiraceae bacterium]
MIFDTHTHYDDEAYDNDRQEVLERQFAEGIGIVSCGADLKGSEAALELAGQYERIYAAVGFHPDNIDEFEPELLRKLAKHEKCRAIGEIGLDYHWDKWPRERQKEGFKAQWRIAAELGLSVVIHSRDAAEDTFEIVKEIFGEYKSKGFEFKADMHCYSYSPELAHEYVKMGMYFGFGGVLTFKNARKTVETAGIVPLDRILLETDCPYLAPEPHRGSRNESTYLKGVVAKLAQIRGISEEEVERVTYENACRFYSIETGNSYDK